MDTPRITQDESEIEQDEEDIEQDINQDSVSEVRNGVEVYKMTLRPKRSLEYAEELRTQPNWRNSEDPEEKHKLHPVDKELQRLKPKAGKGQVEVRISTIPNAGWGLFAKRAFKAGDELCSYEGPYVTDESLQSGYANSDYVATVIKSKKKDVEGKWITEKLHIDAIMETSCYGRFANDPIDDDLVNSKIRWNGQKGVIEAQMDIADGDEIFISYGKEHWNSRMNRLSSDDQEKFHTSNSRDGLSGKRCSFESEVSMETYDEDEPPGELRDEGNLIPLHRPRDNMLTRFMKRKVIQDSSISEEESV